MELAGHLFLSCLSVWWWLCGKTQFNLDHNFWIIIDKDFIFWQKLLKPNFTNGLVNFTMTMAFYLKIAILDFNVTGGGASLFHLFKRCQKWIDIYFKLICFRKISKCKILNVDISCVQNTDVCLVQPRKRRTLPGLNAKRKLRCNS